MSWRRDKCRCPCSCWVNKALAHPGQKLFVSPVAACSAPWLLQSRCWLTSAQCHVLGTYSARCCAGHSVGASSPVLVAPSAAHTSASRNKRLIPAASGGMFSERSKAQVLLFWVFLNGNFVLFLLKALDGERVYLIVT